MRWRSSFINTPPAIFENDAQSFAEIKAQEKFSRNLVWKTGIFESMTIAHQ